MRALLAPSEDAPKLTLVLRKLGGGRRRKNDLESIRSPRDNWYGESSRAVEALTWELQGRFQPPERLPYIKIGDILYS